MPGAGADSKSARRLLLLGGGHAHLSVLRALADRTPRGCSATLISPYARQLYSGMLPGWMAGLYPLEACAIPLEGLARRAGVHWLLDSATGLDLADRTVATLDGRRVEFDILSIDTGPLARLAQLPGAVEHAIAVRPIESFVLAWQGVMARWRGTRAPFRVVIVGDGAAAVELAFAARARARRESAAHVEVCVLGQGPLPMPGGARGLSRRLLDLLGEQGITWLGDRPARRIEPSCVVREGGGDVRFDACLVANGAAAPGWARSAGLATDERGFIKVDRCLRSLSHPGVFAAGDVASLQDERPKSGVYAVRAGPILADNLLAACGGAALRVWRAQRRSLGLLSLGDGRAVAAWAGLSAHGAWVWRWKDRIDRAFVGRFAP